MTESNAPSSVPTVAPNRGVKRGLPLEGLAAAEEATNKLWNIARMGTVPPEAFARQFSENAKASGNSWDRRMAMLRGFRLIRIEGTQVGLSSLGQRIIDPSDPMRQMEARREAVMNLKAYRELVKSCNQTELPKPATLATKLQFEYGKTKEVATRSAQSFVESLRHAEMVDVNNVVHEAGVTKFAPVVSILTPSDMSDPASQSGELEDLADVDHVFGEDDTSNEVSPGSQVPLERNPKRGNHSNVAISMTLDLSNFRADEVVKILGVLGFDGRD